MPHPRARHYPCRWTRYPPQAKTGFQLGPIQRGTSDTPVHPAKPRRGLALYLQTVLALIGQIGMADNRRPHADRNSTLRQSNRLSGVFGIGKQIDPHPLFLNGNFRIKQKEGGTQNSHRWWKLATAGERQHWGVSGRSDARSVGL